MFVTNSGTCVENYATGSVKFGKIATTGSFIDILELIESEQEVKKVSAVDVVQEIVERRIQ